MTTRRKPSAALTKILDRIDEDKLRRTRDRMLVACKISDTLKAKGISQKKFAEMSGRSESEISEWLSGDRNFTIDTLSDIKKYLGLDLLNISAIRTLPVSADASKIKFTKRRKAVTYNICSTKTSCGSKSWLSAAHIDISAAL